MIKKLFNRKKFKFEKPEFDRLDVGKELPERIIKLDDDCYILLQIRVSDGSNFVTFCREKEEFGYINYGKTGEESYHIADNYANGEYGEDISKERFFEFLEKLPQKLPEWFIWNCQ